MATKNAIVTATVKRDEKGYVRELVLDFSTNERLVVDLMKVDDRIINEAIAHGLKQKLVDAAAISRDPANGRSATPETKFKAVKAVYDRLTGPNPSWNATTRAAGSGGTGGLLAQALLALYPKQTAESVAEFLKKKTDEEKAALRKSAKVAEQIALIQAARAAQSGANSDDLLEELGDLEG